MQSRWTAETVAALWDALGVSRQRFAHMLKVDPVTVRRWVTSEHAPTQEAVIEALDIVAKKLTVAQREEFLGKLTGKHRVYFVDIDICRIGIRPEDGIARTELVMTKPASITEPRADGVHHERSEALFTERLEEKIVAAADESAEFGEWVEATNVGDETLAQIEDATKRLASDYLYKEPLPLFARAVRLRSRVFKLLRGHQHPRQTSSLYLAAGRLCALLSWMSSDLGQIGSAEAQGRAAWTCAEMAGHDGLRAWVLSTRSKTAFLDGRYDEAVALARHGLAYAQAGTAAVMLACQEADAWSELGDAVSTMAALRRGVQERERVTSPDDIDGLFSCGLARQANYMSGAYVRLGHFEKAIHEADQALNEFATTNQQPYGTVAQIHITKSIAYTLIGRSDGAAEALELVFSIPAAQRLGTITQRLGELNSVLSQSRFRESREATHIQESIASFSSRTVVAQHLPLRWSDERSS